MIKSSEKKVRFFLLLTSCFLLLTFFSFIHADNAHAHKVQMFTHVEGDKVFIEGYFPDGKKTINSEVTVFDNKSGEELLRGKTDVEGKFSFNPPRKTDLRIALNASLGHKTEYILPGDELADTKNKPDKKTVSDKKVKSDKGSEQSIALAQTDTAELLLAVEKGVEKGVTPLMREFAGCKEHVFYSEIIGGIGYIFGVLGIVLFFQSRKKK
ncbi:MAG: hypothetical protein HZA08_12115 [Nitrospirae bacterium]|nr:hypothetical protein [Nitrospirota bacterium]